MSLTVYLETNVCEACGRSDVVFEANITHNLTKMAEEAGIYEIVWRPDEYGIENAQQLIEPLRRAIETMKADPERFRKHNPSNGWGSYEGLIPWLEKYLEACEKWPNAIVEVSR